MRRLCATVALVALSLAAFPARADAYFWAWLDDLSGPRFSGSIFEVELVCPGKADLAHSVPALESIQRQLMVEKALHEAAAGANFNSEARGFFRRADSYRTQAEEILKEAIRLAKEDLSSKGTVSDDRKSLVTATALTAMAWQQRAAAQFDWAQRLAKNILLDPRKQPSEYTVAPMTSDEKVAATMAPVAGVRISLCHYRALQRDRFFITANVGLALDLKNDDEHSSGRHVMLNSGMSAHYAVLPFATVGVGGGRALFFPSGAPRFGKWYFQPVILDFKPGALVRRAELRSPWRHFVYVRFSVLKFPQGFEARRFSPDSPPYKPEWVKQVGVHFDLAPVLRGMKGTW
jgi:hypothetical protein